MQIAYSQEQQAFKDKISAYMDELMTPELVEELSQEEYLEGGGPLFKKAMQKMGTDGWISHSWPTELGGGGATAIEQFIFTEAIMTSGFPYPFLTVDTIGPMLAQSFRSLPQIVTKVNAMLNLTSSRVGKQFAEVTQSLDQMAVHLR